MLREARHTITVTVVLVVITGVLFPSAVIGVAQVLFPHQANGSLLRNSAGGVIGSELIGQAFSSPQYFHPRPSAASTDGYDASGSGGANYGPDHPDLVAITRARADAYRQENGIPPDTQLPADAVTTSASGLDPHISPANAYLQAQRVARARGMTEARVRSFIDEYTVRPFLRFFGEPQVNVLELNLALDAGKAHP